MSWKVAIVLLSVLFLARTTTAVFTGNGGDYLGKRGSTVSSCFIILSLKLSLILNACCRFQLSSYSAISEWTGILWTFVQFLCCAACAKLCAVLCCAVLCRAVPCRAVPCRAVLCYCAVLCCAVLCCAVLCCAVLRYAVPYRAVLCCIVLQYTHLHVPNKYNSTFVNNFRICCS